MSITNLRREILGAFTIENVTERYQGLVEITNLKDALGTKGNVLVVRGDLALIDKLPYPKLANPKMWLYENLIRSPRMQKYLKEYPGHKIFDGVAFSALEALGYHAKLLDRKTVVVMAHEHIPDPAIFKRWNIEVIHADGPAEEGYVKKQAEVLKLRNDIIPCHQALYGARALAPIGNSVADFVADQYDLDSTYWCIASGSNLYGIGKKIKERLGSVETVVVETETEKTIDPRINPHNKEQVKRYTIEKLRKSHLDSWNRTFSGVFPLHVASPNRYLLLFWNMVGDMWFDRMAYAQVEEIAGVQRLLRETNPEWNWTRTTALTLVPALKEARKGANVLVMSYGKYRENKYRDGTIIDCWS